MRNPEIQRGLAAAGFVNLAFVPLQIQRETQANTFTLAWPTVGNRSYQVEYSDELPNWKLSPTGFLTGSGAILNWTDAGPPATDSSPTNVRQRFYRAFQFAPP